MHSLATKFIIVISLGLLLTACSDESRTRSLLADYPISSISEDEQQSEVEKLVVEKEGHKYLTPGIYCASLQYEYGNNNVGHYFINDGTVYGFRTDTIEVEIAKDKNGNGTYVAAFIMNNRKDIFNFPQSPDSLEVDVKGESVVYKPDSFIIDSDGQVRHSFGNVSVKINGHKFYNLQFIIFAKGGRQQSSSPKSTPTVEEILALNIQHEAMKTQAELLDKEELQAIAQKLNKRAGNDDEIDYQKYMSTNPSQQDIEYAKDNYRAKAERRGDYLSDAYNQTERAKNRKSILKNPSIAASLKSDKSQTEGFWHGIVSYFGNLFTTNPAESKTKTIVITPARPSEIIEVKKGDKLTLSSIGEFNLGYFAGKGGPNGIKGYDTDRLQFSLNYGALIGRFGEDEWFVVGNSKTVEASAESLELRINASDAKDLSGHFTTKITFE